MRKSKFKRLKDNSDLFGVFESIKEGAKILRDEGFPIKKYAKYQYKEKSKEEQRRP
jgi:hypothetical protein